MLYAGGMLKALTRRQMSLAAGLPPAVRGALWMSAGAAFFAVMINLVRYLTDHFDPLQVVFFRNAFGLVAILPWLLREGLPALHTERLHLHVIRALVGVAAMLLWFNTLALMPLAEATALSFTAPIFTSILAVAFLGEIMRSHRVWAIILGFLGALLIVRPGVAAIDPVALLAIVTALVWGSGTVLLKYMSRTETTSAMVIYLPLFLTPISLLPAIFVWTWPTPELWFVRPPVRRGRHVRPYLPDARADHRGCHLGHPLRLSAPALRRDHRLCRLWRDRRSLGLARRRPDRRRRLP